MRDGYEQAGREYDRSFVINRLATAPLLPAQQRSRASRPFTVHGGRPPLPIHALIYFLFWAAFLIRFETKERSAMIKL